jgi:5,10-methylenetetrahydrofolate reductase
MPKASSSGLIAKLKEERFVTTAELEVNSSSSIEGLQTRAKNLQNMVDAIIVNRDPKASLYINPLIPCYLIKENLSLVSIYEVDSRDKNRLGLFSDILTANQLGLSSILVSTGTHTTSGTYEKARPVFDLDAVQLITMIRRLSDSKAFTGEAIAEPARFDIGAVIGFDDSQPEMEEMAILKKKNAGASYFLTLPVYDSERAKMISDQTAKARVPLIVTIYPIDSVDTANWIKRLYPGSRPPEDFIKKIKDIEQSSSTAQEKTKRVSEVNANFVNMLIEELRTVKGVYGCNVVSSKLNVLEAPAK